MQIKNRKILLTFKLILIYFVLFGLFSTACKPLLTNNQPTHQPSTTSTSTHTAINTPEPLSSAPTAEPSPLPTENLSQQGNSLPAYDLQVVYQYPSQTAQIHETITYINQNAFTLSDITLAVDPLRYPDTFILESISINHTVYDKVEMGPSWIIIPLTMPLQPSDSLLLELDYTLNLPSIANPQPDQKPSIFGYTVLQTNFVDWYPFIPPLTEDGKWQIHDAWFFGEYLVYDLADFTVQITLENVPEDSVIAASAASSSSDEATFIYNHQAARNFVWSFSPSFLVKTETVKGIEISSYYFAFNQNAGEQALIETVKAVALYEELFGPYPHKSLAIVEADFLDGMEYDGLYFLSKGFYNLYDGSPQGYLTMIAVHETAHQWWYTKVANDQALEPWLDEALCTYSELIFYENLYPELADWWWEYRVNYYQPSGKIDLTIYDYAGFTPYRDAAYLQGAKFLHQLRAQLGDEQFFTFLHTYASMYNGKISSTAFFWQLAGRIAKNDLTDLMDEFFQKSYQMGPLN